MQRQLMEVIVVRRFVINEIANKVTDIATIIAIAMGALSLPVLLLTRFVSRWFALTIIIMAFMIICCAVIFLYCLMKEKDV